ncbi:MAG: SDR family oxidoreductase [Arthrobacter sp.]|uniref:SDR family oxidoreductase n=1 Tax=unclassified Arthrobacter TaxID=235627 RepID=UPI003FB9CBD0
MSRIAVAGATGYVGGRLVPLLLERGHTVRVLTRNPAKLRDIPWAHQVEVVEGALEDARAAQQLVEGVDVMMYLVHSMGGDASFERIERSCALNVAQAAREAGLKRIVYLSGLHPEGELSRHLASRKEVGEILSTSGTPTVVLQAGLLIGSGSASFEMVRHLTDVLPVMPAPRWVRNRVQPIAVRDALYYLVNAAELPKGAAGTFDIGGPDAPTYSEMMRGYAKVAGLRQPWVIALPVLTPWLAGQWVNLVTPIPRALAIPLVESLQHDCVVKDRRIDDLISPPEGGLTGYERSVELALIKIEAGAVETSWANAEVLAEPAEPLPSDPEWARRTVFTDDRERASDASPEQVWKVIEGIGGDNGWYSMPLAWSVRGWMDKLAGGVGLRRGRRSQTNLMLNDVVDWWRVEAIEPGKSLLLRAEMKVPGGAWLELRVEPAPGGGSMYRQRAIFFPRGLWGRLYWLGVLPFHGVIFKSMVDRVVRAAHQRSGA